MPAECGGGSEVPIDALALPPPPPPTLCRIALEVHRDPLGSEVLVLPEADDLAHHLGLGRVGLFRGPAEASHGPSSPNSS